MDFKAIMLLTELEGKTIRLASACGNGSDVVLLFTDDTMARFKVERGYDFGDEEVDLSERPLDTLDLYTLGLITCEERDERFKVERREHEEQLREARRQQFEELKREFAG